MGNPIRVDIRYTVEASRGRFARVCVEINLNQPVVGCVWLRDHWYHVEYEGLHLLCKQCGIFGHTARNCHNTSVNARLAAEAVETVKEGTVGGTQDNDKVNSSIN